MNLTLETLLPIFTAAGEGQWIELGDHRARPLLNSQQTGGAFSLAEVEVDFGGGVPPHIHEREDEAFYLLEGRVAVSVGEQTFHLEAGDTAFAPRDIRHTWKCESEAGARFVAFITPGGNMEAFAQRMAQEKIVPSDPESPAKFVAIAREFGITMLPPQ